MTSRQRFEKHAKRRDLPVTRMPGGMTRNGPTKVYVFLPTEEAWQAWEAQRRHYARNAK